MRKLILQTSVFVHSKAKQIHSHVCECECVWVCEHESRNSAGVRCARRRQRRVNPFYVFRITYYTLSTHTQYARDREILLARFIGISCIWRARKLKNINLSNCEMDFYCSIMASKSYSLISSSPHTHICTQAHTLINPFTFHLGCWIHTPLCAMHIPSPFY